MSESPSDQDLPGGVGRTLSGAPAEPLPASWAHPGSTSSAGRGGGAHSGGSGSGFSSSGRVGRIGDWSSGPPPSQHTSSGRRLAGLSDLSSGSGPGVPAGGGMPPLGGGMGGDDDDDSEEERGGESWFAGGERSGISVENPDRRPRVPGSDMVRELLQRAARAGPPRPSASSGVERSGPFSGAGNTLGSDEVPSQFIPDLSAPPSRQNAGAATGAIPGAFGDDDEEGEGEVDDSREPTIRHLTFWRDGFSVGEEGPLMRYDDPEGERILGEINAGRAPPSVLGVAPGEPVELRVARKLDQDYAAPAPGSRPTRAFVGSGNRLGSPVPATAPSAASPEGASEEPAEPRQSTTRFEVDQTQPTTSVQVRLADGTRIVARMNLTHTVGDLRGFINAARPENSTRAYTVGTTFPTRILEDDKATIESAGLAGSVVVQRWA